jgi:hypothetical protein
MPRTAVRGRLVTNRNLARGTAWASDIVKYLQQCGWIHAERRALNGAQDRGDIAGLIGVVIEAKNEKRVELAQYLKETEVEKTNAKAAVGVTWIKRRGKGSAGDGYVLMSGAQFVQLLKEAGYQ